MTVEDRQEIMKLDPGVIDTIVALTAAEVEGVATVVAQPQAGFLSRLLRSNQKARIDCEYAEDGSVAITLHIEVEYGYPISELAEKLRNAIADALAVLVGVDVDRIDIYVDGISFSQN